MYASVSVVCSVTIVDFGLIQPRNCRWVRRGMGQIFAFVFHAQTDTITTFDADVSASYHAAVSLRPAIREGLSTVLEEILNCEGNAITFPTFCQIFRAKDSHPIQMVLTRIFFNAVRNRPTEETTEPRIAYACDKYVLLLALVMISEETFEAKLRLVFSTFAQSGEADEGISGASLSAHQLRVSISSLIRALSALCFGQSDRLLVPTKEIYEFADAASKHNNMVTFDTFNNKVAMEIPETVLHQLSITIAPPEEGDKNCLARASEEDLLKPWRTLGLRFPAKKIR